jgi:hypothetical protein
MNGNLAEQCACDAWHICDWVHTQHPAKLQPEISSLTKLQSWVKLQCQPLALLQDVANESKHCNITRYVPSLKDKKAYQGAFDPAIFDNSAFDVSELRLIATNGQEIPAITALKISIDFWESFFDINLRCQ